MPVPLFISDLLAVLYLIAVPASLLTLTAAGLALREGGGSFHLSGRTGKWILWTAILLTLSHIVHWISTQGINVPDPPKGIAEYWMAGPVNAFESFVNLVVGGFIPVAAGFLVLKATLDGGQGESPLPSLVGAIFLLSVPATQLLFQSWDNGTDTATTDMLQQFLLYLAYKVMPGAAGLAVIGATINLVQRRPVLRLVIAAISFLSVSGLIALVKRWAV